MPQVVSPKNSIVFDSGQLQLSGDSASPGNSKLYGTNGSGTKGWYDQPSGGGVIEKYLSGFEMSNGTDTDHDIDITAGYCADSTDAEWIDLAAITKQIDAAWAVGSAAGGMDTGSVAADTWYHVWAILRSDTGVTDALFSTSVSAPTMPTNYDYKRRIGSVLTDSSANIIGFFQHGDSFYWKTRVLDGSGSVSTTELTKTLTVPTGVVVLSLTNWSKEATGNSFAQVRSLENDDNSVVPNYDNANGVDLGFTTSGSALRQQMHIWTNTSAQIAVRASAAGNYGWTTVGWMDMRGK